MAFHKHLIDLRWDFVPAADPQLEHNIVRPNFAKRRLSMEWRMGDDGRPLAHWTLVRD
jgi:hypothetical protein